MMASQTEKVKSGFSVTLKVTFILLTAFWILVLGLSLWFNINNAYRYSEAAARIQARTAFEKDVIYRTWNSMVGSVYAKISDKTLPNPYLKNVERDIVTTTGMKLTMVNPAYMTRLVHELGIASGGLHGHITSNDPIRPANKPTPWEAQALKILESGQAEEVSEIKKLEGKDHLYFIRPLMVVESCMPCHACQGYKVGEVRGGIRVIVPMAPFMAVANENIAKLVNTHIFIWL